MTVKDKSFSQTQLLEASRFLTLTEFSNFIVHEISSPLTVLLNYLSDLEADVSEENKEIFKRLQKSTQRIIDFSASLKKNVYQNVNPQLKRVSAKSTIENGIKFCKADLDQRQIRVEKIFLSKDLIIDCEPVFLCWVIICLIKNAQTAIEDLSEKWIRIECAAKNNRVEISVVNSGPKISEQIIQKLFRNFYTTKDPGQGNGFNLIICERVLRRQKATISVRPENPNTCFVISFEKKEKKA